MTDVYAEVAKVMRTDRQRARTALFGLKYGRKATLKELTTMDGTAQEQQKPKSKRGFATMDRAKQKEIASKGGKKAHSLGVAHEFTQDEAKAAGRKGGETVARNLSHMAEIGRRGGLARGENYRKRRQEIGNVERDQRNDDEIVRECVESE